MEKLVVSPVEAAKLLQTRPDRIRNLCQSGEIIHYKDGRNIKIPVKALEEYVMDRAKSSTSVSLQATAELWECGRPAIS